MPHDIHDIICKYTRENNAAAAGKTTTQNKKQLLTWSRSKLNNYTSTSTKKKTTKQNKTKQNKTKNHVTKNKSIIKTTTEKPSPNSGLVFGKSAFLDNFDLSWHNQLHCFKCKVFRWQTNIYLYVHFKQQKVEIIRTAHYLNVHFVLHHASIQIHWINHLSAWQWTLPNDNLALENIPIFKECTQFISDIRYEMSLM